jgi:uncharacterized repeat protein (TIGR01451 family)
MTLLQKGADTMSSRIFVTVLVATGLLLTATAAIATAADNIRFTSKAEIEVEQISADGSKRLVRQPAALVVPGTGVIYTNTFRNIGDKPAERLVITNPIPEGMEYLGGSALPLDADITFSIDGGRSFDRADQLFVSLADGSKRLAEAEEYTHIRWTISEALPPGAEGNVEFRAHLK